LMLYGFACSILFLGWQQKKHSRGELPACIRKEKVF